MRTKGEIERAKLYHEGYLDGYAQGFKDGREIKEVIKQLAEGKK
jgi:flagellar biosynthesis/type III secretory pathway protein FliH